MFGVRLEELTRDHMIKYETVRVNESPRCIVDVDYEHCARC